MSAAAPPPGPSETGTADAGGLRTPGRRAAGAVLDHVVRPVARRSERFRPHQVALALLALGATLAVLLAWFTGEIYESVVDDGPLTSLDVPAMDELASYRTHDRNAFVTTFSDLGGPVWAPVMAVVLFTGLALAWRRWEPLVVGGAGLAVALLMATVGKDMTGRARPPRTVELPPYESSTSFPSGHTVIATVLASLVVYQVIRMTRRIWLQVVVILLAVAWALAMGLSRVYLAHHWLSDVLSGWAIGLGWVAALVTGHQSVVLLRASSSRSP